MQCAHLRVWVREARCPLSAPSGKFPRRGRPDISPGTARRSLSRVRVLPSWDRDVFVKEAFVPAVPALLPHSDAHVPPACRKWFLYNDNDNTGTATTTTNAAAAAAADGTDDAGQPDPAPAPSLNSDFWEQYADTPVTLECTSRDASGDISFERLEDAPLALLLAQKISGSPTPAGTSLYLAQSDLSTLPGSLTADLPTPTLILRHPSTSPAVKGDVYASSLWLGLSPTYTPLHRDPNPNLFVQLAGRKTVRLYPPHVGDAIFADVRLRLRRHDRATGARIRGEEMMAGPERTLLHEAVWPDWASEDEPPAGSGSGSEAARREDRYATARQFGLECTLHSGHALFIPKGWWHSVKGLGSKGVTASANWWFR